MPTRRSSSASVRDDGTTGLRRRRPPCPRACSRKLAGIPYCPDAALAARRRQDRQPPSRPLQLPGRQPGRHRHRRRRRRPHPLLHRRQRLPRRPLQGRPALPGGRHPGRRRPLRPRHRRRPDRPLRRPETAQVHAVSDPSRRSSSGIPLDIRSIALNLDRPSSPSTRPAATRSRSPAQRSAALDQASASRSRDRFQVGGCDAPRLQAEARPAASRAATKRARHPALTRVLTARARRRQHRRASVALPHSRVPRPGPHRHDLHPGPVRRRRSARRLDLRLRQGDHAAARPAAAGPGLPALLQPQAARPGRRPRRPDPTSSLVGRIDTTKGGGIRTTFEAVPDAPVTKFVLETQGGKKGLLETRQPLRPPTAGRACSTARTARRCAAASRSRSPRARAHKQRARGNDPQAVGRGDRLAATLALAAPAAQPPPPEIQASWVTDVSPSSANLRAEVNPDGSSPVPLRLHHRSRLPGQNGFDSAAKVPAGPEATSPASASRSQRPAPERARRRHLLSLPPRRHKQRRNRRRPGPILRTDPAGATSPCPTTAAGRWSPRSTKTAARSRASAATSAAACCRPPPRGTRSPTARPPPSAPPRARRRRASTSSTRGGIGLVDRERHPADALGHYPEEPDQRRPLPALLRRPRQRPAPTAAAAATRLRTPARSKTRRWRAPKRPKDSGTTTCANAGGGFGALLTERRHRALALGLRPVRTRLRRRHARPGHVVLSTCAALTPRRPKSRAAEANATRPNRTSTSSRARLRLINLSAPGAELAAQSRAISADGSRVYWTDGAKPLPARRRATKQVDRRGRRRDLRDRQRRRLGRLLHQGGHLYRYRTSAEPSTDLTPAGGPGRARRLRRRLLVYYLTPPGLFLGHEGPTLRSSPAPTPASYPPATGTARVSADGRHLALRLHGADYRLRQQEHQNRRTGARGLPLHRARRRRPASLVCVSCNPIGGTPDRRREHPRRQSPTAQGHWRRTSTSRGSSRPTPRVFFDTLDALVAQDTNNDHDVYQWEAQGAGSCARPAGCVGLISSGRGEGGATSSTPRPTAPTSSSSPTARSSPPTPASSTSTTPASAAASRSRRRRSPASATPASRCPRTRRPDARHPATEDSGNLPTPRAEETAQVQEEPGQTLRQCVKQESAEEATRGRR